MGQWTDLSNLDYAKSRRRAERTQLNGKPIADSNQLRMSISMMAIDSTVNLKVLRNGGERDMAVKLGVLPTDKERASVETSNPEDI